MLKTRKYKVLNIVVLLLGGLVASGCVSDTLSNVDTAPQQLAAEEPTKYDPVQREQAIAEIRAKAEQPSSGELTSPYVEANGPNEPFTPREQAKKIAELKKTSSQNDAVVTDSELAEKQRSIRELQQKANSHYGNALKQIKN